MDELLQGCDGTNALSWTLWDYEPTNTHSLGDGWNGEDLSLFSYDDIADDDDISADSPIDLRSLAVLGSRAIGSWCRPYPAEIMGRVDKFTFDMKSTVFEVIITVLSLDGSRVWQGETIREEGWTLIYLPLVHYLRSTQSAGGENRVIGKPGTVPWTEDIPAVADIQVLAMSEGRLEIEGQWARWYYPLKREGDRKIRLKLQKWTG